MLPYVPIIIFGISWWLSHGKDMDIYLGDNTNNKYIYNQILK